jgi:hypothetical protein
MIITAQHTLVPQWLNQALTEGNTQPPDAILRHRNLGGGFAATIAALLAGMFLPLMFRR